MIDFGGWEMPVTYVDISSEHLAVRRAAGLFDLGHMGRVSVHGPDAAELIQKAQTNNLDKIPEDQIRYAMLLKDDGGVIDDILVHRRRDDIFLVVNASNRETDIRRLRELAENLDVVIDDQSESMGMIAIQGPKSAPTVQALAPEFNVEAIGYYHLATGQIAGHPVMLTRTGYTGEDGFEIYAPNELMSELWDQALVAGKADGIQACGLGARDTLRLEAGMPLYGHEITLDINPVEAGLMFGVRLKKPDLSGS